MPDGRILYVSQPSGKVSLWVLNRDGSNPKEFPVGVWAVGVSACRDGRYVLFSHDGIVRVDSEGGNLKHLTTGDVHDYSQICSPDGQWVVYLSDRANQRTLWEVPIDGGTPVQLRNKETRSLAISRDGKWIACMGIDDPNQPEKLLVVPIKGGPPSQTFAPPPGARWQGGMDWAPDGRSLTFSAYQKGASNVWAQPLAGGPPQQLTDFESGANYSLKWSFDGKQLALVRRTETSDAMSISNSTGGEN
jgi:Tol biopolymer transport system component